MTAWLFIYISYLYELLPAICILRLQIALSCTSHYHRRCIWLVLLSWYQFCVNFFLFATPLVGCMAHVFIRLDSDHILTIRLIHIIIISTVNHITTISVYYSYDNNYNCGIVFSCSCPCQCWVQCSKLLMKVVETAYISNWCDWLSFISPHLLFALHYTIKIL